MTVHDLAFESSRQRAIKNGWKPRNCVWEITLACNLQCKHCGSRAGKPRGDELSAEKAIDVANQLVDMGLELVTLSGGEPTVRNDWDQIAKAMTSRGTLVNMVTNGAYRDEAQTRDIARRAKEAGMSNIGVSLDGPKAIHDAIRGKGAYDKTVRSIRLFAEMGMKPAVMTTVCQSNYLHLEETRQIAIDLGASMWRLQLSKPMGVMDDNRHDVLTKEQFHALIPKLAKLKKQGEIQLRVGDSIGYFGAHEKILRGKSWRGHQQVWRGCQAGLRALGIEANGGVKGCLSLQMDYQGDDKAFLEGSLKEKSLEEIWYAPGAFAYNRDLNIQDLTGDCKDCRYASQCRGGARCVGASMVGKLTEDPYCFWALDASNRKQRGNPIKQSAAAAAAALVLTLMPGCDDTEEPTGDADLQADEQNDAQVDQVNLEYGVEPDMNATDYGVDVGPDFNASEYGVEPDATEDFGALEYGVDPDMSTTDYGVEPADIIEDTVQTDYGVEPTDVIEDTVQTDYGVEPMDVIEDTIQTDYGVEPDVVEDATATDYGVDAG